jgi:hypothetical protein
MNKKDCKNKTMISNCKIIYINSTAYNEVYRMVEVLTYHDGRNIKTKVKEVENLLSDYAYNKKIISKHSYTA